MTDVTQTLDDWMGQQLAADPLLIPGLLALAKRHEQSGDIDRAARCLQQAAWVSESVPDAVAPVVRSHVFARLAGLLSRKGLRAEAVRWLKQAARVAEDHRLSAVLRMSLADAMARLEQPPAVVPTPLERACLRLVRQARQAGRRLSGYAIYLGVYVEHGLRSFAAFERETLARMIEHGLLVLRTAELPAPAAVAGVRDATPRDASDRAQPNAGDDTTTPAERPTETYYDLALPPGELFAHADGARALPPSHDPS